MTTYCSTQIKGNAMLSSKSKGTLSKSPFKVIKKGSRVATRTFLICVYVWAMRGPGLWSCLGLTIKSPQWRQTHLTTGAYGNAPLATPLKLSKGSSSNSVSKKRKDSFSQPVVDTSTILGVVDPESNIKGTIEVIDTNEPCDCMLVRVDPTQNIDKFYILQLIKSVGNSFIVYTRWGRTGTAGQGLEQKFDDYEEAAKTFEKKFQEKTGLIWEKRNDSCVPEKYRVIKQNFVEK